MLWTRVRYADQMIEDSSSSGSVDVEHIVSESHSGHSSVTLMERRSAAQLVLMSFHIPCSSVGGRTFK